MGFLRGEGKQTPPRPGTLAQPISLSLPLRVCAPFSLPHRVRIRVLRAPIAALGPANRTCGNCFPKRTSLTIVCVCTLAHWHSSRRYSSNTAEQSTSWRRLLWPRRPHHGALPRRSPSGASVSENSLRLEPAHAVGAAGRAGALDDLEGLAPAVAAAQAVKLGRLAFVGRLGVAWAGHLGLRQAPLGSARLPRRHALAPLLGLDHDGLPSPAFGSGAPLQ